MYRLIGNKNKEQKHFDCVNRCTSTVLGAHRYKYMSCFGVDKKNIPTRLYVDRNVHSVTTTTLGWSPEQQSAQRVFFCGRTYMV